MTGPVAVVGSHGFLGGALVRGLHAAGVEAAEFTRQTPLSSSGGAPAAGLARACAVFYAAGTINPAIAERDPDAVRAELDQFSRFLDCVRRCATEPTIVLPSSGGTVYDADVPPPYAEDSPTRPSTAYGRAKLAMEELLLSGSGYRPVVLRVSNAYGPGQRIGKGQGVIGHWLDSASRGEPIHVFGDVETTRDYVYVDDVVAAMLATLDPARPAPSVINVGSGVPTSLRDLADLVAATVGGVQATFEAGRGFDRSGTWLDVGLAEGALGWRPRVDLADGLARTWQHFRVITLPDAAMRGV